VRLDDIRRLARDWIAARGEYSDAWEALDGLIQSEPKTAFRVIEEIHFHIASAEPVDYELMANLAAGPLETLLGNKGEEVISSVLALAKSDAEFRKCLAGVWQHGMSDDLYAQIRRACDHNFRFA